MKVKPKEIMVNLPIVLLFEREEEIPLYANAINSIIYGKLRLKYEELGVLGDKHVGLFYIHRTPEYQELRDEFINLIDIEQREAYETSKIIRVEI